MSTAEILFLLLVAMLVGITLALGYSCYIVVRSERWFELKSRTMETVLRDMYGHNVEELNETLERHRR